MIGEDARVSGGVHPDAVASNPVSARVCGMSLVGLVVTVAAVGILTSLAAPSFASLIRSTRLTSSTNEFVATLVLARSEAIKRGRRVTLCSSRDGTACAVATGWQHGWIVYEDANEDGQRGSNEAIIHVASARPDGLTIGGNLPVRNYVSYVPTGASRTVSGAPQMGTITLCSSGIAREVVISATGRPRVIRNANC